MTRHPTGTVTFLFTDVEGSTRLWERSPEAARQALSRHDALIEQYVGGNSGCLVRPRGEGDSRFAVFPRATDAIAAARDIQLALAAELWPAPSPLRVRIALHTGEADLREGDYYGPEVNRCARLRSLAYGGQVLLSQTTYALVRDALSSGVAVRDLGEHRLKDLQRPEHVYQLVISSLPSNFPSLKSLDALPNNLPLQLTSFIGRESEIRAVKDIAKRNRLFTLTGPGGTGKTRLGLQVAAELIDLFQDGVCFVELAPLAEPALVSQAVANVLGLRQEQGQPLIETVLAFLRDKQLLLILDNCEHLIDECARLAARFLHGCAGVKILATSREALGIAGEVPYRVPSLSLPLTEADVSESEAARLFVDRAITLQPSFSVTQKNASAIAQICRRLDGIPLALELAAARVKVLSPEQIARRLDDRFRLLTGGNRTALPRQQTLRAMIDWSYSLLSESERILFRRLSVFAGGWTLEGAQAVCGFEPVLPEDVLDLLARLVDKSLVLAESQGETVRYRLMETIRQDARDKLLESNEGEEIRTRHLDWFLQLANEAQPKLRGPDQRAWLERLEVENDNLRAGLEWSTYEGCVERGMRLSNALLGFWDLRAYWREGTEGTLNLLAQPEALPKTATRANALYAAAHLLSYYDGERQREKLLLEESIAIARERVDEGMAALASSLGLAGAEIFEDDLIQAENRVEEGLTTARSLGDAWLIAFALYRSGQFYEGKRDHVLMSSRLQASFELFESLGDRYRSAQVSVPLAREEIRSGQFEEARLRLEKLLAFKREEKHKWGMPAVLNALGVIAHAQGDYDLAKTYYMEALRVARELGSAVFSPAKNLACILLYEGEIENAKTLLEECMSIALRNRDKATLAYAIQGYAGVAAAEKQPRRAIALLAATRKLQEDAAVKAIISPAGEADFARHLAIAREQVDEETFETAWAEGRAMTQEQAVEIALEGAK